MRKVDVKSLHMFEVSLRPREVASHLELEELYGFLLRRHQVLTTLKLPQASFPVVAKKRSQISGQSGRSTKNRTTDFNSGVCEEQEHNIYSATFNNVTMSDRAKFTLASNLCKIFLLHKKSLTRNSKYTCSEFKKPHHSLLHYVEPALVPSVKQQEDVLIKHSPKGRFWRPRWSV